MYGANSNRLVRFHRRFRSSALSQPSSSRRGICGFASAVAVGAARRAINISATLISRAIAVPSATALAETTRPEVSMPKRISAPSSRARTTSYDAAACSPAICRPSSYCSDQKYGTESQTALPPRRFCAAISECSKAFRHASIRTRSSAYIECGNEQQSPPAKILGSSVRS